MCKDQSENLQIIDNGIYILKTNSCKTSFIPIPSLLGGHEMNRLIGEEGGWGRVMVFNTTFNKISVILWWSVLLVEET
jgi:hypothetical protein